MRTYESRHEKTCFCHMRTTKPAHPQFSRDEAHVRVLQINISTLTETRAVRGSDYSPAIALSKEKDKLV